MEQNIYLEITNQKHHKFYELKIYDTKISINYGRIGRKGKSKIVNFTSMPELEVFFEKQLKAKIKKGYHKAIKGLTAPKIKGIHPGQLRIIWI